MNDPLTRFGHQRRSASRRHGIIPGRRFALMLALTLVWSGYPAAASADPAVVSATIYQGSGGGVTSPSVSLSTLQNNCPPYSGTGTSPMYLYPSGQPYQPATNSSWALSTVLQCGLQVPLNQVTSVQVYEPPPSTKGFELPLTSAQLTDPSQFQDHQAPQALPVISHNGGEDQNTYTRPYLGGSDDNGADQITQSGPIALVVYENGSPLQVTATSNPTSQTATTMNIAFSATVQGSDGSAIPASALTWNWSFGDGTTSTDPTPSHPYPLGDYFVTLQVTDASAGLGGTATIKVSAPASPGSGATPAAGGGTSTKPKSPTGPQRSRGPHAGGPAGKTKAKKPKTSGRSKRSQANAPHGSNGGSPGSTTPSSTTTPAGTGTTGTPAPTVTSTPAPGPTVTSTPTPTRTPTARSRPARAPHGPRAVRRPARPVPATGAQARLVTGRLISEVKPVPPASSPLVRKIAAPLTTAPAVRRPVGSSSSLAAIGAGFAVVLLLGLGAGCELSWQLEWRPWRPPGLGS